ncbi:MAG TPA: alpha/beta hydrolase [Blastocatellia bacterium]|jgi:pimeloyl-ACP methyl ester carboxylesterase|nr:alpha/beta hydrolase [Blastocatellia bacterium]
MITQTSNGPIYYETAGDGPPLVFVSGWAMSSECWRPAIALLRRKYRCLTYDARGIGRSQPVPADARFEVEDQAEDLHTVMEAARIYDAAIIGHEHGSMVAAICSARHPQDMSSLTLVSPRSGIPEDELKRMSVTTPASLALRELASFPFIRNVIAWRFRRAPQPFRDRLFEDFANLNPRAGFEMARSLANPEAADMFERFIERADFPALLVCGEKDKKGIARARRLFSLLGAGKLATVKGSGFLPMLEYPEQFARLLDGFVAASAHRAGNTLSLR